MKYGALTFVRDLERDRNGNMKSLFRCACGTEKVIRKTFVVNGRSRSCGCTAKRAWRRTIYAHAQENFAKARGR